MALIKPDLSECFRISLWPEGSVISYTASFSLWSSIDFSELGLSAQPVQGSLGPREVGTASCWPLLLRAKSFPDNSSDRDGFSSVSKRLQRSSLLSPALLSAVLHRFQLWEGCRQGPVHGNRCVLAVGAPLVHGMWRGGEQQRDAPYTAPKEGTKGRSWADLKKKEIKRNPQALMEQVEVQQYR